MSKWKPKDMVKAHVAGKEVDARVTEVTPDDKVLVRIAVYSELLKRWMVSTYKKPLRDDQLKRRYTQVDALDKTIMVEVTYVCEPCQESNVVAQKRKPQDTTRRHQPDICDCLLCGQQVQVVHQFEYTVEA